MTIPKVPDPQEESLLFDLRRLPADVRAHVRGQLRGRSAPRVVLQEPRNGRVGYRRLRTDEVGVQSRSVHEAAAELPAGSLETTVLFFNVTTGALCSEDTSGDGHAVRFTRGARRSRWSFVCPACETATERVYAVAACGLSETLELTAPEALVGCRSCLGLVYRSQAEHKTALGDERRAGREGAAGSAARMRALQRLVDREERALKREERKFGALLLQIPGLTAAIAAGEGNVLVEPIAPQTREDDTPVGPLSMEQHPGTVPPRGETRTGLPEVTKRPPLAAD